LNLHDCYVYKTGGSGTYDYNQQYNKAGITDLIVISKKGVSFLEVKPESKRNTKDGGLTGKQPEFRDLCERFGVMYAIVYSVEEARKAVLE